MIDLPLFCAVPAFVLVFDLFIRVNETFRRHLINRSRLDLIFMSFNHVGWDGMGWFSGFLITSVIGLALLWPRVRSKQELMVMIGMKFTN